MKKAIRSVITLLTMIITTAVYADMSTQDCTEQEHPTTVSYLQIGTPTFDITISQFRKKYDAINKKLPLSKYHTIAINDGKSNLTRAASKINENLYSSTALEHGSGKVKTLQITRLPFPSTEKRFRMIKL